jgi:hypothetical protein
LFSLFYVTEARDQGHPSLVILHPALAGPAFHDLARPPTCFTFFGYSKTAADNDRPALQH